MGAGQPPPHNPGRGDSCAPSWGPHGPTAGSSGPRPPARWLADRHGLGQLAAPPRPVSLGAQHNAIPWLWVRRASRDAAGQRPRPWVLQNPIAGITPCPRGGPRHGLGPRASRQGPAMPVAVGPATAWGQGQAGWITPCPSRQLAAPPRHGLGLRASRLDNAMPLGTASCAAPPAGPLAGITPCPPGAAAPRHDPKAGGHGGPRPQRSHNARRPAGQAGGLEKKGGQAWDAWRGGAPSRRHGTPWPKSRQKTTARSQAAFLIQAARHRAPRLWEAGCEPPALWRAPLAGGPQRAPRLDSRLRRARHGGAPLPPAAQPGKPG